MFALILLFVLLVLVLLKRRASRRESRLRAAASEIDPTSTPLDHVDTREELGRHVSVNDNGLRPEMPRPTGALCFVFLSSSRLIVFSS